MGTLKYLMLHQSRTEARMVLKPQHIIDWHTDPKPRGNGWSRVGYSDLILRDGSLYNLSSYDQDNEVDYNEMTWGARGTNGVTRHLCLEGGLDDNLKDVSPLQQWPLMYPTLRTYLHYTILRHPLIKITGHYLHDPKKSFCPGFDISTICNQMQINPENIHE